jgi:hypothetical protein
VCVEGRKHALGLFMLAAVLDKVLCLQAASMKSSAHGAQQGFVLFTFGQQATAALQTINGIEYVSLILCLLHSLLCNLWFLVRLSR